MCKAARFEAMSEALGPRFVGEALPDSAAKPDTFRKQPHSVVTTHLIDEAGDTDDGGLLAVPLADTLKRAADGRVAATLDRTSLWCAQTPQLFRYALLRAALASGTLADITDEASAMERAGHAPRLIPGASSNLKVTTPEDLLLARAVLQSQGRLHEGNER